MITHNDELKEDADQDDIPYIINNIAYMPEGRNQLWQFKTLHFMIKFFSCFRESRTIF